MTYAELVNAIQKFVERDMLLEDEAASEALFQLEKLVPNADLRDIIFYELDDCSHFDEIAKEALLREQLWATGGRRAVRERRRMLMERVLADGQSSMAQQFSAKAILRDLDREEAEEKNK